MCFSKQALICESLTWLKFDISKILDSVQYCVINVIVKKFNSEYYQVKKYHGEVRYWSAAVIEMNLRHSERIQNHKISAAGTVTLIFSETFLSFYVHVGPEQENSGYKKKTKPIYTMCGQGLGVMC